MDGSPAPLEDDASRLDRLLAHEGQYLDEARRLAQRDPSSDGAPAPAEPDITAPRRDLCGLALSGGGIRSATFNLGLLQCLQQMGLLEMFDYVSTVSGGGYIGGFWTAWRHYHLKEPSAGNTVALFPMSQEQGARGARFAEVRHLREFSNFLNPRLGLLSLDTGRMFVAALSAVLPSLLAAFSFLVLVLLLWLLLAWLLLLGWEGSPPWVARAVSYALMIGVTCGALFTWELLLFRQDNRVRLNRGRPGANPDEEVQEREGRRFGYYLNASVLAVGTVLFFWQWLVHAHPANAQAFHSVWWPVTEDAPPWRERLHVFDPAIAWVGAAGALVLLRWLSSRFATAWMQRTERAAMSRVISRLLLLASFWSVLSCFWLAGMFFLTSNLMEIYSLLQTGVVATVMVLSAAFARLQQLFSRRATRPVSPTASSRLRSYLPQLLAYTVLALSFLGAVMLVLRAMNQAWLPHLVGTVIALTGLTLLLFDANSVGLHAFYRDRIARTFIGAAHGQGPGQTELHSLDDFSLDRLKPQPGPLHLICCAANDLASIDPMANLYRGADSAVLSSVGFSVGPEWKSWEKIRQEGGTAPTLASAMTASAAAFNSHMGSMSMRLGPAVTFLMTAFNLRLGLWWPHPTRARRRWYERLCVGLPFYKELLGRSRAKGRDVLLSDGAHFENLALYELVRRRCRFIIVSDCGMDADTSFDDFANVVRRVREDFGVELRIDLSPLRPDGDTGLSRRTVVAGDLEYPDGSSGVLLLIKPSLQGNEPPDILQYKTRNTAFPHETTGDQFYDEAQWEAYRRLGEHTALTIFRSVRGESESGRMLATARLFARVRNEWLPVPSGYEERFPRFVERATALDQLLEGAGARKLFREIFKEITELDRQAKTSPPPQVSDAHSLVIEAGSKPTPQELTDALHMIRRALLFMEEVFLTEQLAAHYNHPAYRGVVNYFARWGYAPLLRTWWPLLKTLHSPRFTHFLEERFSLPTVEHKDVGQLGGREEGFAMSCWVAQGGRKPRPHEHLLSYILHLPHGGRPEYPIQAAQLIVRTHQDREGEARPLLWSGGGKPERRVVLWQGDDFYVPPGLWGAGIGEDFLRLITEDPLMPGIVEPGSVLAVRLQVDREASAARRKRWADELHLYHAEGFTQPDPALKQWLADLEPELDQDAAMPWAKKKSEYWKSLWLTRLYQPTPEATARREESFEAESTPGLH
ncbi:hypothetical protein CYFUS_001744 [Cystobacter fuscus]|uniref:Uncharacterized protein n=1 Tax=Cystobacter fuscus TaxID=43 RepID=A0A250IYJ2_9BACT|nr:patatin-like phospholipase family protein [Cystobacter fuscus]ATB36330.1 hypothetical protein CYFUS_001744 [Cystobacter fuscus]